jgi:hypothetical protein
VISKSLFYCLGLFALGALFLCGASQAQNLAPNPGAENWTGAVCDHWAGDGGASYVQSTTAHGGSYALQVSPAAAYSGVNLSPVPLTVGQQYTVTCWIRGLNAGDTQPLRLMMYGGGSYPQTTTGNISGTAYQQYTLTFTADGTSLTFNVVPWDAPVGGFQFLIDDVVISQVVSVPIDNGGFEDWSGGAPTQNWAAVDGASISQSTDAHSGLYALQINPHGINFAGVNHWPVAVQAGQTYRLTCWLKGVTPSDNGLVRFMFYGWGGGYPQTGYWISDTEWRRYTLLVTFMPGDTQKNLNITAWDASGGFQFLVDDVSMELAYPQNLVGDSSLETGWSSSTLYDTWVGIDGGSYSQSTTSRGGSNEGGQYAMQIDPGQALGGVNCPVSGFEIGATYDLTCWIRAHDAASTQPMRLMMYGGGSYPQTTTGNLSATSFHPYSLRFVADATTLNFNLVAWDAPTNGFTCLLDDVVIQKVPTGEVQNGDMELISGRADATWPLHWQGYNATYSSTNVATSADEGARAIYVTPQATYQGLSQSGIPVEPDKSYTLACALRRDSGAGTDSRLRLKVIQHGGVTPPSDETSTEAHPGETLQSGWQVFYLPFTTAADTTTIDIMLDNYFDPAATGSVTWGVDDVKLLEGTVPVELSTFKLD